MGPSGHLELLPKSEKPSAIKGTSNGENKEKQDHSIANTLLGQTGENVFQAEKRASNQGSLFRKMMIAFERKMLGLPHNKRPVL